MADPRPTVLLCECPSYDATKIRDIVAWGLERLELRPFGRTLVKPNVVNAGEHFPHAYTRPEFIEGVLMALRQRAEQPLEELAVGERCGITVPTRYVFGAAGYNPMARRQGARLLHFDELSQAEIPLGHPGRLRDSIFVAEPIVRADFFVNCPKFKAHPWTTVTFSLKNYIGIQDDRHRLIDHDHRLNQKVVDLQHASQPQFVAIDAITAGEGRMLTPIPFDLGMVIMGNNQVAVDAVCCHLIGLDASTVAHIQGSSERGFGPIDLEKIAIDGDVTLAEAKRKADGFRWGLIRIEDYFKGTSIVAHAGPPPGDGPDDYCWGGCPGALEEAIEILRVYDTQTDEKMPRMHLVIGDYDGPIDARAGEKVVFLGDCTRWHGEIDGRKVKIESTYVDRSRKDPLTAKGEGIYKKMWRVGRQMATSDPVVRLAGCPVSVAEQVLALVKVGGLNDPYRDPGESLRFTSCYLSAKTRSAVHRLFGEPYNKPGYAEAGEARRSMLRLLS